MDLKDIKQKLHDYFEGNSSSQDEEILRAYFSSGEVDEELQPYSEFFGGLSLLSKTKDGQLEEDIMDFILESEHKEKNKYRWLWQSVTAVAAALMIALLVVNFNQNQYKWEDTYSDPDQAYVEARRTLEYVAGKYQKGLVQLQPVKKLNTASQPLTEGMDILEKGFQEVQTSKKISEKLKKQ
ncbi:hypothetical protein ACUNWD_17265 [Sunxiuqinia sp. A32]|uniref:hypothetical protein n=1 Tax=Sunxiuqinia sp. A32 TaxID=3461496 RepID=UPI004045BF0B